MEAFSTSRSSRLAWVMLAGITVAVYARTLRADFVNWDDAIHVYANPRVTASDGLRRAWVDGSQPGPYPVLYATHWLEWRLGRGAPWLFHLDNALLHAANALLVGVLGMQLLLSPTAALLAAALWALHPLHVESVAWVSERKNVLYVFFWLLSLLLFMRARDTPQASRPRSGAGAYAASLLLFVMAILSKAAALTLPAALVMVEWARGRRLDRRFWLSVAPFAALALVAGIGLLEQVPPWVQPPPLEMRLAHAARVACFYLTSFFWLPGLVPVYPRWSLDVLPGDVLAASAVVALGALVVGLRARLPHALALGAGVFVTNVILVLGVVWTTYHRFAFVADHFAYLPSVGLALAAVALAYPLARAAHLPPGAATLALVVWCGALAASTWAQVPVWRDSETLWGFTLARNPSCWVCHQNLGVLLMERGASERAAAQYEAALRLEVDPGTTLGLAVVREAQGRLEEAATLYEQTMGLDPGSWQARYDLAHLRQHQGRIDDAIELYREALRIAPESVEAHTNLGVALLQAGRLDEGRAELEETLRLQPHQREAEINLRLLAGGREE